MYRILYLSRKRLNGGTVPPFKMHPGGTVPPFKMHPGGTLNFYDIFFWKTPVLSLGLGVDVTFALDNKNNHNDNNPHLILWE